MAKWSGVNVETTTLYGGDVILEFDIDKHLYRASLGGSDPVIVPGVTGISGSLAKPQLVPWAAKVTAEAFADNVAKMPSIMHEGKMAYAVGVGAMEGMIKDSKKAHWRVSSEAADRGTVVHTWAEKYVNWKLGDGEKPALPLDTQCKKAAEALIDWIKANKVTFLSSERKIFSRQYLYAGTCDILVELDGKLGVWDFKTSKGIYDDYAFQVAAYASAVEEEDGRKVEESGIIRLDKTTGMFETARYDREQTVNAFSGFTGLLAADNYLNWIKDKHAKAKKRNASKKLKA